MTMNNELKALFDVNISTEDILDYFDDTAWENNVADAAFLGAVTLKKDPEKVIHDIVHYNVLKRLRELFISKSKPLPKQMIFDSELTQVEAFYLLENFIAQVVILKQAEKLTETVKLSLIVENEIVKIKLKQWCLSLQNEYKNEIEIKIRKINENKYSIVIK